MFVPINTNSKKVKTKESFGKAKETLLIIMLSGDINICRLDINSLACT